MRASRRAEHSYLVQDRLNTLRRHSLRIEPPAWISRTLIAYIKKRIKYIEKRFVLQYNRFPFSSISTQLRFHTSEFPIKISATSDIVCEKVQLNHTLVNGFFFETLQP